ncbi:DUF58 domain-containing protein [Schlesneria sp. T3-172]|uniref:DUF58 domain-containing protein n=1 Tax=Schlesneria sphaerica TaxID=3373610 RepID=UPI0037CBFF5C
MTQTSRRFLPPEAIARISRLEILARNVVEGFLSGLHRSPYFGQSVEFAQHREYAPGDDIRRIDWKVWSKTDRYYIKQYEEETNLRTLLLVDQSESMQFGSGKLTKYEYACQIAASLAYLLLRQQDAVGITTFDSEIRSRVPFSSKQNHLHAILATLDQNQPSKKTDLQRLLAQVADEQTRRGLIVVISDLFVDRPGLFKGLKLLRTRGHDVMVMHVMDDEELDFQYSGTTKFEGMEETGDLVCDPRALREGYLKAVTEFVDDLHRNCARQMIDFQTIRTSEHLDAALAYYVTHRVGMRKSVRS